MLQNTNTSGVLVREQAGNKTKGAEPTKNGHRTLGVYGGWAPVKTSRLREDNRRSSNSLAVGLTLQNTNTLTAEGPEIKIKPVGTRRVFSGGGAR